MATNLTIYSLCFVIFTLFPLGIKNPNSTSQMYSHHYIHITSRTLLVISLFTDLNIRGRLRDELSRVSFSVLQVTSSFTGTKLSAQLWTLLEALTVAENKTHQCRRTERRKYHLNKFTLSLWIDPNKKNSLFL